MLAAGILVSASIGVAVAAAASDPTTGPLSTAGGETNTEVTPAGQTDCSLWTQIGGAVFPGATSCTYDPKNSATPFTADLYTVRFASSLLGFAGGAQCKDPATALADIAAKCDAPDGSGRPQRVPVLYKFTELAGHPGTGSWSRVELPGGDRPGYVGAIAYLTGGRVLAVGGDGIYPKREPAFDVTATPTDQAAAGAAYAAADPAGHARAWLYSGGGWCELGPGAACGTLNVQGQPAMRGLTAVDCSPRKEDFCVAGAFQQLWMWQEGRFVRAYTHDSPQSDVEDTSSDPSGGSGNNAFRFRVRAIRFLPGSIAGTTQVAAVTSGCCAQNPAQDVAQVLLYTHTDPRAGGYAQAHWTVGPLIDPYFTGLTSRPPGPTQRQTIPDSYLSFIITKQGHLFGLSVVASPGGSPAAGGQEPSSRIYTGSLNSSNTGGRENINSAPLTTAGVLQGSGYYDLSGDLTHELVTPFAGTVRLMSGDGDLTSPPPADARTTARSGGAPDGVMDWAVGSWTGSGPQLGEGVAYTTTRHAPTAPNPLDCPGDAASLPVYGGGGFVGNPNALGGYLPTRCKVSGSPQAKAQSQSLFALGSYALNGFAYAGSSAVGWAVGDKGAIVRLGGSGSTTSGVAEPAGPALGASLPSASVGSELYDAFGPTAASAYAGVVPGLSERPVDVLAKPRFIAAGSPEPTRPMTEQPEDVVTIVMSRDGSEGWALGGRAPVDTTLGTTTLYHYLGGRWSRCDTSGIDGVLVSDPACASLRRLRDHQTASGLPDGVVLYAAARVPYENGSDPSKTNQFEMVAFGSPYPTPGDGAERPVALRYTSGRWSVDASAMRDLAHAGIDGVNKRIDSVAFTAPDDGWMSSGGYIERFVHGHWVSCKDGAGNDTGQCDDAAQRLAINIPGGGQAYAQVLAVDQRVYVYGYRPPASNAGACQGTTPLIIYHDPGKPWVGSLDPGFGSAQTVNPADLGVVTALSVSRDSSGNYVGWATGRFGEPCPLNAPGLTIPVPSLAPPQAGLERLAAGGQWAKWSAGDGAGDYLRRAPGSGDVFPVRPIMAVAARGGAGGDQSVIVPDSQFSLPFGPALAFDTSAHGLGDGARWSALATPFPLVNDVGGNLSFLEGVVRAVAPDGAGGSWWAVRQTSAAKPPQPASIPRQGTFFYHYTRRVPRPVFDDVPHPVREAVTGVAGQPNGRLWLSTARGVVYRYDRMTGWNRFGIAGWDPGRLVTSASQAFGIAVNASGEGVLVGRAGRIADISTGGVVLDPAAGRVCALVGGTAPCSTGFDIRAVSIAPDGSALAGGDHGVLLYRPAGGSFASISTPEDLVPGSTITGISMPSGSRAWLTASSGQLYSGQNIAGQWHWTVEDQTADGRLLTVDYDGTSSALRSISVDTQGHGFAVGDRGVILSRGAGHGWVRMPDGSLDNLSSVALAPGGASRGALVGGDLGLVLTLRNGRFEVARHADFWDPLSTENFLASPSRIVGLALMPGYKDGQVEAWAAQQRPPSSVGRTPEPGALLHYTNDPNETLLQPTGRAQALADAPGPRPGEIALAALGKSECVETTAACPELTGTSLTNEVGLLRTRDAIAQRAPLAPTLAAVVYTGDASDSAGSGPAPQPVGGATGSVLSPTNPDYVHHRFEELLRRPLGDVVPVFAALGGHDLSDAGACQQSCTSTRQAVAGASLGWRESFAGAPAPWGSGDPSPSKNGMTIVPVTGSQPGSGVVPSVPGSVPSPDGSSTAVPAGGANTHYAFDVERGGSRVMRVVFVDTSLRSLEGSVQVVDANGHTVTESQLTWLDQTLAGRDPSEQAVVVSSTPSYSYGPGATTDTLTDASSFEQVLQKDRVNAVVSGRLGWNALFWATAPAVHVPCSGENYPDSSNVPSANSKPCSQTTSAVGVPDQASQLAGGLQSTAAPAPPAGCSGSGPNQTGVIPNMIASSAGGRFGPDGQAIGTAGTQGFWHGYTIIRLDKSGDPRCTIVEQRPVFDWVGIQALGPQGNSLHVLQPGQHLTLRGYGREPVGSDQPIQYDDINGPAITHRFDLLQADPQKPWLPATSCATSSDNPNGYCVLDPAVGHLDYPSAASLGGDQTGIVRTGNGNHARTYAIGLLSVGGQAATWPIVFEPRRSFVPKPPIVIVPPAVPQIHVASALATAPPPAPSAPPPTPPSVGTPGLPQLPGLPSLPGLTTPPLSAPPPPNPGAPPAPPAQGTPSPLSLNVNPASVSFAPPSGVIPPPAPPIQPAPPGGAKREAKAKQPAAAKSAEGNGDSNASEAQGRIPSAESPTSMPGAPSTRIGGDGSAGPPRLPGSAMTRLDRVKPGASFTPVQYRGQPSAWSRDALYGGGLAIAALILALGFSGPGPMRRHRRRSIAAPAWARPRDRNR